MFKIWFKMKRGIYLQRRSVAKKPLGWAIEDGVITGEIDLQFPSVGVLGIELVENKLDDDVVFKTQNVDDALRDPRLDSSQVDLRHVNLQTKDDIETWTSRFFWQLNCNRVSKDDLRTKNNMGTTFSLSIMCDGVDILNGKKQKNVRCECSQNTLKEMIQSPW